MFPSSLIIVPLWNVIILLAGKVTKFVNLPEISRDILKVMLF